MIKVKLMDGSMKEIEDGSNGYSLATSISRKLAKEAVAAKVNGKLVDLSHELKESDQVEIITVDSEEGIEIIRHSTAHVMAQAVKRIYGNVKLAIGPTVKNGFYYDFDLDTPLTHGDIEKIEEEMNKIINEDLKFKRKDVSREEALKLMSEKGEMKVKIFPYMSKEILQIFVEDHIFHLPNLLKLLSLLLLQEHIGEAVKRTRCFKEFMGWPLPLKRN